MDYASRIRAKLVHALSPTSLEIDDESARHAGHSGYDPRGETHFRVTVVSNAFCGMSRIDRQRRVYEILSQELGERVHALSVVTRTPEEVR